MVIWSAVLFYSYLWVAMASMSLSFCSCIVPSRIPHDKSNKTHSHHQPTFPLIRFGISAPAVKKRHWKKGEFPATSQPSFPNDTRRKTPLKNLKKKFDKKNDAKAWVNTVTESLSERIHNKHWLQALQVPLSLTSPFSLYLYETNLRSFWFLIGFSLVSQV